MVIIVKQNRFLEKSLRQFFTWLTWSLSLSTTTLSDAQQRENLNENSEKNAYFQVNCEL